MAPPHSSERRKILEANWTRKMARSTYAFLRGGSAKFYEWLDRSRAAARLPNGPELCICGQLDERARRSWAEQLDADREGAIDAPSWLWESVVALAGDHETGYLEHCRQYALAG